MLGIGVAIRGERRFGGFAIASGVIGFVVAYLATLSGVGKLESVVVWSALFAAMLRYATPLIFAAIGGMFSERSGVVNIGLEGMMLMGAFFAVLVDDKADSWILGLAAGVLARVVPRPSCTRSSRSTCAPTRFSVAPRSTSSLSG